MKTLLAVLIFAGASLAQNSDLGVLAGISGPKGQTTTSGGTTTATGSVSASFQLNYAWQVVARQVDLYIELPLVMVDRANGTAIASAASTVAAGSSAPDVFFTPGVRAKFSPQSRVSFYAAAGLGFASFAPTSSISVPSLTVISGNRQNSFAVGFGGGIDFRLTRLLSLRGDLRDFVTGAGLGEVTGRNHAILQAGIAFHF
jgi:opacity protein-like surface antigen